MNRRQIDYIVVEKNTLAKLIDQVTLYLRLRLDSDEYWECVGRSYTYRDDPEDMYFCQTLVKYRKV